MGEAKSGQVFIEFLKGIDAPTISNAIEQLHLRPRREGFTAIQLRGQLLH